MLESGTVLAEAKENVLVREARELFRKSFLTEFGIFFTLEEVGFIESWFINNVLATYQLRQFAVPNLVRKGMANLLFGARIWVLEKIIEAEEKRTGKRVEKAGRKAERGVERVIKNASRAQELTEQFPGKMAQVEEWNRGVVRFFDKLQPGFDKATEIVIAKPVEGALILMTKASEILGQGLALAIKAGYVVVRENLRSIATHRSRNRRVL